MILNSIWCTWLLRKIGKKVPIFKSLRKPYLKPVRVKLGFLSTGMLIASYCAAEPNIVFIEAIWYRKGIFTGIKRDLFKVLFETFMLTYINTFKVNDIGKLTVVVKLEPNMDIEDLWALDLHGFHPDPTATLDILEFKKPWRDQEELEFLVYSRSIA
jgi:hypothetical protein